MGHEVRDVQLVQTGVITLPTSLSESWSVSLPAPDQKEVHV